ncbi:MAG: Tn3 family transposase [Hymenobacter sp.]|jgi:TnpA family transposase|nr:Tn3 family transposase [Hymenobacter sp.]
MISPFLTAPERQDYQQVPATLSETDLRQHFHLTGADREFIQRQRRDGNRLGCAVQLGLVRLMGYLPEDWFEQVPPPVAAFVGEQLGIAPDALASYGERAATRSEHLQLVLRHLGYRKWQPLDSPGLEAWLLERALEHDQPRLLLQAACQKLHQDRLLRPAVSVLELLVSQALLQTDAVTYQRLAPLLTPVMEAQLDALLAVDPGLRVTPHRWLCQPATANTPTAINQALAKLDFLHQLGLADWDAGSLNANRRKRLAHRARHRTSQAIGRYAPAKRYPLLVAFVLESHRDVLDAVLTMFSDYWAGAQRKAQRAYEAHLLAIRQAREMALRVFAEVARTVVDEQIPAGLVREAVFETIPREQVEQALQAYYALSDTRLDSPLAFLLRRYAHLKQFSASLLRQVSFASAFAGDRFAEALALVVDLQTGVRRKLPADAPADFITPSWYGFVHPQQAPERLPYELCVLATLRERLRSGDVFVPGSRKYADLESYLIPAAQWPGLRGEVLRQLGLPADPRQRLHARLAELEGLLPQVTALLAEGGEVRLEDGELVLTALQAEELPASLQALDEQIRARMPAVELTDILVEVDGWTGFSELLREASGGGQEGPEPVYAALLAAACNIPLSDMARSTGLDYQTVWWATHQFLHEQPLRAATTRVVNQQHRQWLARHWGGGGLSSSDGQRFPVSGAVRNAKALPRYFGYGRGVTFYTHTADHYAQYGSKVIPATERDATYVLDEVLGNETDVVILEHATDTHGYTDLIFGLFDLLGLQYSPRLRDIGDQKLCRIRGRELSYPGLHFTGHVQPGYIEARLDDLLRIAGSFKLGYVTASLFIGKLQAYPRQHNLTYVLQQYGRLIKTNFILRYLLSQPLRRKIHTQLNKGERLHALRVFLWFGGGGLIRRKQEEAQQEVVGALNLVTNLVVLWNTVYLQQVVQTLRAEGVEVRDEDLARLSPARYEHINRLGKYTFPRQVEVEPNGLRSLRKPLETA